MYNEEYLFQVEEAIKKLQSGERVVSIAYGDHVVRYAEVDINDLLSLRQRIKVELKIAGKRKIVFATNKGIDLLQKESCCLYGSLFPKKI